jgi:hypothetical protein
MGHVGSTLGDCGGAGLRKRFFLKKEARTFAAGAAHGWRRTRLELRAVAKVFWFCFQKRTASLTYL